MGDVVVPAAVGAMGGVVMDVAWGYVAPRLPPTLQAGWAGLAAKLGVIVGARWAVNRFLPRYRAQARTAAVGAITVALYGAFRGAAQSVVGNKLPGLSGYMDYNAYALPGTRMHGYMPSRAGMLGDLGDWFSPAAVIQPAGVSVPQQFGGYMPRPAPLAGYVAVQPHMSGGGGLMGYDWQNDGM